MTSKVKYTHFWCHIRIYVNIHDHAISCLYKLYMYIVYTHVYTPVIMIHYLTQILYIYIYILLAFTATKSSVYPFHPGSRGWDPGPKRKATNDGPVFSPKDLGMFPWENSLRIPWFTKSFSMGNFASRISWEYDEATWKLWTIIGISLESTS